MESALDEDPRDDLPSDPGADPRDDLPSDPGADPRDDLPSDPGADPWEDLPSDPGALARWVAGVVLALVALLVIVLVALWALSDDHRDPTYRDAFEEDRALGPTSGVLDDGSKVGAVTFFDEDGTVCAIFGPPGERGEERYCVPDTDEEVDAINWEVDPARRVDLTVVIADGSSSRVGFGFDGRTPGHGEARFAVAKPAVVAVYVGPPWDGLDIDTGTSG